MKPWIKECGESSLEQIQAKAYEFLKNAPKAVLLAACTDSYQGEALESGEVTLPEQLLELRLFTESAELWAHRTTTAHPFAWRIADDDTLKSSVRDRSGYFADPGHYQIPSVQKLDIDTTFDRLRTTGGRYYTIPITDENAVRLIQYVDYDENGNAHAVDFRVAGFEINPEFVGGGKKQ